MDSILLSVLILELFVILVHVIALRMLICVKNNNISGSQKLLLIVLCVTELTFAISDIGSTVLHFLELRQFRNVIWMFSISSCIVMYIFVMIYITVDRFMEIYLNIKYHIHWCTKKTKVALAVALVMSLLSGIPAIMVGRREPCNVFKVFTLYVYPILEAVFVIVASFTYFYIIKQVRRHRKVSERIEKQLSENSKRPYQKPRNNRFRIFVPTLIIITFILFTIGPNIIKFCVFLDVIQKEDEAHIAYIFIAIGFISDPLIYILNMKFIRFSRKKLIPGGNTIHITSSTWMNLILVEKYWLMNHVYIYFTLHSTKRLKKLCRI